MADLTARLGPLTLPNPLLTASGCAAMGHELDQYVDVSRLGALVTPSLTRAPRSGGPTPRMVETASGLLNATGLPGPGIDAFIEHDLAWLTARGARTIVSIAGGHTDEFVALARALYGHPGVSGIEINIACSNLESRGQAFAGDAIAASRVVGAVRRAADPAQPVFAKLTADVTDIGHIARVCADAGVDGFSLINTVPGLVIDTDTLGPAVAGDIGGLSGPAIRPIALRCVWQVKRAVPHLPILGMGGITSGLDALQFVLAGASAVAVGTAIFGDPSTPFRVLDELDRALDERGFAALADAVGFAQRSPATRSSSIGQVAV